MIYDKQAAAEDWYNDSRKTKQDLMRWYAENGGTESLDDPDDASMLREDWADIIMAHYAATKLVILNKTAVDIDVARNLMDDDICGEIRGTVDTEQEFVDAYCAAHEAKYGETFTVN